MAAGAQSFDSQWVLTKLPIYTRRLNDRRDTMEVVLKYVAPSAFFVKPTNVEALVAEMDAYNVAAADAGYDLWAFWHDNRHIIVGGQK